MCLSRDPLLLNVWLDIKHGVLDYDQNTYANGASRCLAGWVIEYLAVFSIPGHIPSDQGDLMYVKNLVRALIDNCTLNEIYMVDGSICTDPSDLIYCVLDRRFHLSMRDSLRLFSRGSTPIEIENCLRSLYPGSKI